MIAFVRQHDEIQREESASEIVSTGKNEREQPTKIYKQNRRRSHEADHPAKRLARR